MTIPLKTMMDKTFEMIVDSFQDSKCDPNKTIYEFLNDVFEPFKNKQDTPENHDALKYSFIKNLRSQFLQYEIVMDDKDKKLLIATIIGSYGLWEADKSDCTFFNKSPLHMTFQQLKDEINKPVKNIEIKVECDAQNIDIPLEKTKILTLRQYEKKIKEKEELEKIKINSLTDCFNKMVEKYNLQDFVKKVEESFQNPFIAILPFIQDAKDLEEYHHHIICSRL